VSVYRIPGIGHASEPCLSIYQMPGIRRASEPCLSAGYLALDALPSCVCPFARYLPLGYNAWPAWCGLLIGIGVLMVWVPLVGARVDSPTERRSVRPSVCLSV
jgi:hypothetical protein